MTTPRFLQEDDNKATTTHEAANMIAGLDWIGNSSREGKDISKNQMERRRMNSTPAHADPNNIHGAGSGMGVSEV